MAVKETLTSAANKAAEAAKKAADAAKKAAEAAKKDPIGAAATAAKTAVGGVTGVVQSGVSAAANSKLLKGTKVGTTVDFVNTMAKVPGVWQDIGIDAVAGLASGIYQGKSVSQLEGMVVTAAKKSTKGNVDEIVDKTMACLQAYDPSISKQDVASYAKALKEGAKRKL